MIIYKTTNLINGKFYIGKDSHNNPDYYGSGIIINAAIQKYGKENFIKEIIDTADNMNELNEKEKYWIKTLNAQDRNIGYNIANGGDGGDIVSNHPNKSQFFGPSWRKKISENLTGKPKSEEHKKHLSETHVDVSGENNPMYGKCAYDIWVDTYGKDVADEKQKAANKMRSNSLNKYWTPYKKEARSKRYSGRNNPRYKAVAVLQFTLENEFVKEWKDLIEIKEAGINPKTVSAVCRGLRKTAHNHIWKFKNNEKNVIIS